MNLFHNLFKTPLLLLLALPLIAIQCDDSSTGTDSGVGELNVKMTDAPFPVDSVSAANVTITRIDIRSSEEDGDGGDGDGENGEDNDSTAFTTLSEQQQEINLLNLQNGVTQTLSSQQIEAGSYNQIRLYISDASIELKSGQQFDLKVPSGAQSGLKINVEPDIEVEGGLTAELLLDFDVSKSFVMRGNPLGAINGFIFKPVVRGVNQSEAGRINGSVTHANADTTLANANVWVTKDTTVSTAFTDEEGNYAIIGLPEGTYNAHATMTNYDTATVEGVEVTAGNETTTDFQISPLQ